MIFDTTILIAHLRGHPDATRLLTQAVTRSDACCSVLSRVEIEGGMRSHERRDVGRMFYGLDLVPVSDPIAAHAGKLLRRFRDSHPGIDVVDYVIAATATITDSELVTLNVKHFPMFPGLARAF